jgi:hypothetical protein
LSISLAIIVVTVLICITVIIVFSIQKGYYCSSLEINVLKVIKAGLKFRANEKADADKASTDSENTL